MTGTLRDAYDQRIAAGLIVADAAQTPVLAALSRVEAELPATRPAGLFRKARILSSSSGILTNQ